MFIEQAVCPSVVLLSLVVPQGGVQLSDAGEETSHEQGQP